MLKKEKEIIIDELADSLSKCAIVIATDYRGLTAKEMVQLRRQLSDSGIEYRVAKNTLTRFAAGKTDMTQLEALLTGPVALTFGFDDAIAPAKALNDYIRSTNSVLQIKGGLMGDRLLNEKEIVSLASIPPKEVLLGQLVGQLASPLQSLHNVFSSPIRGLLYVIQARIQQVQGG